MPGKPMSAIVHGFLPPRSRSLFRKVLDRLFGTNHFFFPSSEAPRFAYSTFKVDFETPKDAAPDDAAPDDAEPDERPPRTG